MKKRAFGAGAVVLVAVGIWLGTMFDGFGTGDNESETDATNGGTVQVSLTSDADPVSLTPAVESQDNETTGGTEDVLTLLVDDDQYLIQWGEDWHAQFSAAALEDIVDKASAMPGDENGVRVRVRYKENAQNGAFDDLRTALTDAGLKPEAIIQDSDPVADVE